jgi:autophagy-related protein 101
MNADFMTIERKKVRGAMEMTLSKTAMKIVMIACQEKDHIPAINQKTESNPFPFLITINPKSSWGTGMGFQ